MPAVGQGRVFAANGDAKDTLLGIYPVHLAHFVLGPPESILRVQPGDVPAGAAFIDYDRNGVLDIWITQNAFDGVAQGDRLYWGEGNGLYQEATDALGLATKPWNLVADLNTALTTATKLDDSSTVDLTADDFDDAIDFVG